MTRYDLTKGYVKRLAIEIKKAYHYFGEYDERLIRSSINRKIEELANLKRLF